jgi:Domain of unknown function (DUF4136)
MKRKTILILAIGTCVLAGCLTPANVSAGSIQARTFSFINPGSKPDPAYADNHKSLHTTIQRAITKNLEARGVKRVGANGDVTVAYLVITGNNVSTTTLREYFGYRDDGDALHKRAQKIYTGSKNPNHFEAGTLVIDFIDGKTFKLLKRGYATRSLLREPSASSRTALIQGVVDEILRDVRVSP